MVSLGPEVLSTTPIWGEMPEDIGFLKHQVPLSYRCIAGKSISESFPEVP